MTISVIVVDDEPIVRAGIVMLLRAQNDIDVVAESSDGAAAVALTREYHPDVVLMDVRMAGMDGVTATRLITDDDCQLSADHLTKVIVLTTFDDDEAVYGALRAGASGFLLKHAAPNDLVSAVRKVAAGDAWIDPGVTPKLIRAIAELPQAGYADRDVIGRLTPREREVLVLVAHGMSNREITDRLVLSEATVKTHVGRVLTKTGSRDRAQAVALAYQSGLVVARPRSRRQ